MSVDNYWESEYEILYKAASKFLCSVNRVTANHRHGNKVKSEDLDRLSNYQIDFEKIMGRKIQ